MSTPILIMENIHKKLSESFSLRNINLNLYKGEVHVLLGENGSGKSSLMNVLWGTYSADSGRIYLDGKPVQIQSPIDAKKYGIAMIHQEGSLFEHFSVAENIFLDTKPLSNNFFKIVNWNKMHQECRKLFDKLNFNINSKEPVKNLGISQRQLVEIAKAYISNARIIIMDEPTSSLTKAESTILFNIICELKKAGVSIFYISHRLEEIKKIGDRISVIRDGQLIGTQDISNMSIDNIIHMMTGLELKERYPKLTVGIGREVLAVKNLSADNILKDISFSLRKKEILGITGLVGSGRTKIAKSIFGMDRIDSGEIFIDNKKVVIRSPREAIKAGIGYITEDRNAEGLFMYLKVAQNITACSTHQVSGKLLIDLKKEQDIVDNYIRRLNIKVNTVNDEVAHLSGGNQQKVVLAKWMMSKSKIFIMDEPTRGIDIASKVDVYNLMNELVRKGASVILASSDINEVLGMCDRILVLYGGRIVAEMSRCDATQEKVMYYATGGSNTDSF